MGPHRSRPQPRRAPARPRGRGLGPPSPPPGRRRQIATGHEIQQRYADQLPVIPLFPGPVWGAYTDEHFTGWPSQDHPYASLSTRSATTVLVLNSLRPRT